MRGSLLDHTQWFSSYEDASQKVCYKMDIVINERIVRCQSVSGSNKTVLHTFPITLSSSAGGVMPKDTEYEEKALKAAAHAQLVPDSDLEKLTTRMHASRSGPLEPFGDDRDVLSQTKRSLDQVVRERGYLLRRWMVVRMGVQMNTGIALMTSIFASVPTFFGSRRTARQDRLTNIGTGPSNLNHTDRRSQHRLE